ncbi:hypothetical protein [Clostridium botulinum]|nr:hypothetical protein [Clostridium botulinum]
MINYINVLNLIQEIVQVESENLGKKYIDSIPKAILEVCNLLEENEKG